jgi:hypothetical protein
MCGSVGHYKARVLKVRRFLRKPMEDYKGRHIGCAPGTHAALAAMIPKHVIPSGAALDLGAHSGALLLRLQDLGFSRPIGADPDPTRFDVPGADFKRIELNCRFAHNFSTKFQLVTATDVIEHLDSPRNSSRRSTSFLVRWMACYLSAQRRLLGRAASSSCSKANCGALAKETTGLSVTSRPSLANRWSG